MDEEGCNGGLHSDMAFWFMMDDESSRRLRLLIKMGW